jgi:hypothetical protein
VDRTVLLSGLSDHLRQLLDWQGGRNSNLFGLFADCRQRAGPDDRVFRRVRAEDDFSAAVGVEDRGHAGLIEADKIQETRILMKRIRIV